jgi:hypothetical protein
MKQIVLVLVVAAGCSKSKAGVIDGPCEGAACFAKLEHNVPEFKPDKGTGAYFWETKNPHVYLEIRDTKSNKALIIETKKPMKEGVTYPIGGRIAETEWNVSGFSDVATSDATKGTVKVVSLPKQPLEPVIVDIDLTSTNEYAKEWGGPEVYKIHGRAIVGVYVSNGK